MGDTSIQWTDKTWNPTRGCSRISPGCENCYAERQAIRHAGPGGSYEGMVRTGPNGPRWTGKLRLVADKLDEPIHWRKPARIFVNSMSDLFHEKLLDQEIAAVFAVMEMAQQHTFQILTKRAERMRQWVSSPAAPVLVGQALEALAMSGKLGERWKRGPLPRPPAWPLPNVWLGVSVEDEQRAAERIPHLLATPAALAFLSVEPLLGPLDVTPWLYPETFANLDEVKTKALGWVIVGGESGHGARPFDLLWARSLSDQCGNATTPYFFKQAGSEPRMGGDRLPLLEDHHGGDLVELRRALGNSRWDAVLRREFPAPRS